MILFVFRELELRKLALPSLESTKMSETNNIGEHLQITIRSAVRRRCLARGLNEVARALDRRNAVLCVLSKGCNEEQYTRLIMALCDQHQIPMMQVDDSRVLGEWAGLVKYDENGDVRKVVKTACVVVTNWDPAENESQKIVQSFLK